MKAEHLQAFCAAAKFKSITRAAEALGSTQPRVSRQLAALQVAVGDTLYQRTAYGIVLTAAGEALLPYACAVAQTLEQATHYVRGKGSRLRVTLRLGLSHSLAPSLTPHLIERAERLGSSFPHVRLGLSEGYGEQLIERLMQRKLDAAFIVEPYGTPPQTLIRTRHGEGLIGLLVPDDHPLAGQTMVPLSAVAGAVLILPSEVSAIHKRVQACLARGRIRPAKTLELSGPAAVVAAVRRGWGIGVVLQSYVESLGYGCRRERHLEFVQLEENGFVIGTLSVTHDLTTLEPAVREALEALIHGVS